MRTIRISSFVLFAITMCCSYFWYQLEFRQDLPKANDAIAITIASNSFKNAIDSLPKQISFRINDTSEIKKLNLKLNTIKRKYVAYKEVLNVSNQEFIPYEKETPEKDPTTFWIKVIFSFLFAVAALYVVLSNKYDDDTKKWAFNVLTLISGIWIGAVSTMA